jgi:hypothetical protein
MEEVWLLQLQESSRICMHEDADRPYGTNNLEEQYRGPHS